MNESSEKPELGAVRAEAIALLASAGVIDPEVDADLLIGHVLDLSRGGVAARVIMGARVADDQVSAIGAAVARRAGRIPLQHITGRAPFRNLELHVGPGVFVPRPETELIAQIAIDALRSDASTEPIAVDLGTGSGAIALAMATEVRNAKVFAVERSMDAYPWALRNVTEFGAGRTTLVLGDLAEAFRELDGTVGVVASNPPYVPAGMIPADPEVASFDPAEALYSGEDGLDVIPVLSRVGLRLLRPGGLIVIEHAEHQSAAINAILTADGWRAIAHHQDLTSRERATSATRR